MSDPAPWSPGSPAPQVHSTLSGTAGDVVQARDISGGVHFHQAWRPGVVPRQLPADMRGFAQRGADLARLDQLLASRDTDPGAAALWVVTGTGGVGKTALAVHWAHRVTDRFPDGQLYVNLRGYDPGGPAEPDQALDQFLRAFGLSAAEIPADLHARAAMYRSLVADLRVLVVLDNAVTADQVRPLLPGTPSSLALVTSRDRLPGLVVRDGAQRVALEPLARREAMALLRATIRGHRQVRDSAAELAELAGLCAGLPLTLLIVAERAVDRPDASLSELAGELRGEPGPADHDLVDEDDFAGTSAPAEREEPDREGTRTRDVLDWSYRKLSADAASLLRLLSLHPGPEFSTAAADALFGTAVEEALEELVGAHLLERVGADRYQFHDLLRAFAVDRARVSEPEASRRAALHRLFSWYLHTADAAFRGAVPNGYAMPVTLEPLAAGVEPLAFSDQRAARHWYERERDNLIAAVEKAFTAGLDRIAWQLPAVLGGIHGYRHPVGTWLPAELIALEAARRDGDQNGEAVIRESLGIHLRLSYRFEEAVEHFLAALDVFEQLDDPVGQARSMNGLGLAHRGWRRPELAGAWFERGLAVARESGRPPLVATLLRNVANLWAELGQLEAAENALREATGIFRAVGEELGEAITLCPLAGVQRDLGRFADARESLARALGIADEHGNPLRQGLALQELGRLSLAEDSPAEALEFSQRAAARFSRLGSYTREAQAIEDQTRAYCRLGRLREAVAVYARVVEICRAARDPWRLGHALDDFAHLLSLAGDMERAWETRSEALELLAALPDPGSATLTVWVSRERSLVSGADRDRSGEPPDDEE